MSNKQRVAMLAIGLIFLVIATVVLLSSKGNNDRTANPSSSTQPTPTPAAGATNIATPLLVSGKIAKISVSKGDRVELRVLSKGDDELHVHGYDISKVLVAGKTTVVSFDATIDGVFEVEFESAGEQVAQLTVNP
ncbi:MAG: hypothetical protein JHC87_00520 [Thermoleophilaceae bacterium]|nr:hypothetical protein [Thermoleophilaceae bacterium]